MAPDRHLERWIVTHRYGGLDPVFQGLSLIGSRGLIWILISLVLAAVWRRPNIFLWVTATALVADLIATGFKYVFGRDRPPLVDPFPKPLLHTPSTPSFPSGHATMSFACAVVLSRAAPRFTIPFFVLAALVSFSRNYVGVHYPLDTLAGAVLGTAIGFGMQYLIGWLARRRGPAAP